MLTASSINRTFDLVLSLRRTAPIERDERSSCVKKRDWLLAARERAAGSAGDSRDSQNPG